jgi:hypothetical protein
MSKGGSTFFSLFLSADVVGAGGTSEDILAILSILTILRAPPKRMASYLSLRKTTRVVGCRVEYTFVG